jgi:hypothetical protein
MAVIEVTFSRNSWKYSRKRITFIGNFLFQVVKNIE